MKTVAVYQTPQKPIDGFKVRMDQVLPLFCAGHPNKLTVKKILGF